MKDLGKAAAILFAAYAWVETDYNIYAGAIMILIVIYILLFGGEV